jgi:hypothetical protein
MTEKLVAFGLTVPNRNPRLSSLTSLFSKSRSKVIRAWVVGVGGPSDTKLVRGNTLVEVPGSSSDFPSEHIEVAKYLRAAGKIACVSVLDFNEANLSAAREAALASNVFDSDAKIEYTFHHANVEGLSLTPLNQPHAILFYNVMFLHDKPRAAETLLRALRRGGYFFKS